MILFFAWLAWVVGAWWGWLLWLAYVVCRVAFSSFGGPRKWGQYS